MTEPSRGVLHFHVSKLLVAALVAAVAATGALVVTVLVDMPSAVLPPPPGPNGPPPPPPNLQPLAVFPIVTGFFVLSWLAVLVVFSRDQILGQLRSQQAAAAGRAATPEEIREIVEREVGALEGRLTEITGEYGERRETDGYLNGMRAATTAEPTEPQPNVRSFRRPPPR